MKSKIMFILQALLGGVLIAMSSLVFTSDSTKMLSGLCIGSGACMLVLGIGNFIRSFVVSSAENEKIKQLNHIEVNDERNTRIREKTGNMVAKIMNYVLTAFILILGFMGVDKIIIIMAATLIVIEFVLVIFFSNYYSKRM